MAGTWQFRDAQRLKTSGESHYLKNLKAPRVAFTSQNRTRLSNVGCRLSGLVPWSSAHISDCPACKWSQRSHRHAAAAVLLPQCATTDKPVFVQIDWGTPQNLEPRVTDSAWMTRRRGDEPWAADCLGKPTWRAARAKAVEAVAALEKRSYRPAKRGAE